MSALRVTSVVLASISAKWTTCCSESARTGTVGESAASERGYSV